MRNDQLDEALSVQTFGMDCDVGLRTSHRLNLVDVECKEGLP